MKKEKAPILEVEPKMSADEILLESDCKVTKSSRKKASSRKVFDKEESLKESQVSSAESDVEVKIENNKESFNTKVEAYLTQHYEFQYNTIKSKPEFRQKNSVKSQFKPIRKYDLNSLKREIESRTGLVIFPEYIKMIIESDFSPKVNPVHSYFLNLPKIDPNINQFIRALASTVTVTTNPDKWLLYFTKWLTGVAANALTEVGCQNHVCLVLTGSQGKFKTTFLDHLCPRTLTSYLFTGKIDPSSKDVLTLIGEYLFINIDDQLKALNKNDENELKNLITTPAVKYRRPYDVYIEEYPHLASFMASVNSIDFLTDPSGSRRFVPFEVEAIDIKAAKSINMDNVYSEIMFLYTQRFRYWFNDEEVEELHRLGSEFLVQTMEYEMLLQHFGKPTENDTEAFFMTTSQILNHLQSLSNIKLSEKRMGEALKKAGFERRSKRVSAIPIYGFLVIKLNN